MLDLDAAVDLTRTGDVWCFRGRSPADRIIRVSTNSPINHVGMAVVLEDLPPLMWHAELGQSLLDVWSGGHHRGVQLHDLQEAVLRWARVYGQQCWLRQLEPSVTAAMEDSVLQTIARLDGTPFPSTAALAGSWLRGRLKPRPGESAAIETAYCAEVLARTYQAMGLLPENRRATYYDPGSFWSGDDLALLGGFALGPEIEVRIP